MMNTTEPDTGLPWQELSLPQYIEMKSAWLEHWRAVLPKPSQRRVLTAIVRWQNYQTGGSFRGYECLAKDSECQPKTVQRAVAELERMGLLKVNRLRDAPRNSQGMLVNPRRGGRANNYSVDYNTVRLYDGGDCEWEVGSSPSVGELGKALRRARDAGRPEHDDLQRPSVSTECLPNGLNGSNEYNGSNALNTTSMDAAGRARNAEGESLRPRAIVTAATTAEDLRRAYPVVKSEDGTANWCLGMASAFAVRAAREWPDAVAVNVGVLARLFADAVPRHGRAVLGRAVERWVEVRLDDRSMRNPGAVFFGEAETYFAQAAVDADQEEDDVDDRGEPG